MRYAHVADIDKIYDVMNRVSQTLEPKDYFITDSIEFLGLHIQEKGFTLLAEHTNEPIGYAMIRIPGLEEDNLGYDMNDSQEELLTIAHIEAVAILPAFRGQGLQIRLVNEAENILVTKGFSKLMATVHPLNSKSLNNFLRMGFNIVKTKEKYGGYERHILMKILKGSNQFPADVHEKGIKKAK